MRSRFEATDRVMMTGHRAYLDCTVGAPQRMATPEAMVIATDASARLAEATR